MSVHRVRVVVVAGVAASTLIGLVATEGVASAATGPKPPTTVTATQCTKGGGKVVVSYINIGEGSKVPFTTCSGGIYRGKQVKG